MTEPSDFYLHLDPGEFTECERCGREPDEGEMVGFDDQMWFVCARCRAKADQ